MVIAAWSMLSSSCSLSDETFTVSTKTQIKQPEVNKCGQSLKKIYYFRVHIYFSYERVLAYARQEESCCRRLF